MFHDVQPKVISGDKYQALGKASELILTLFDSHPDKRFLLFLKRDFH